MSDTKTPVPSQTPPHALAAPANPWPSFSALRGEIDRLFEDFWPGFGASQTPRRPGPLPGATAPAIDLTETETGYRIAAELPGMDASNVELSLSEDLLTIKGEKKEETEEKKENYHLSERRFGSFQRSFRLPRDVDREKIDATFDKGVLTVLLPKAASAAATEKKIEIKPGS